MGNSIAQYMCTVVPLVLSTCGEHSVDVRWELEDLVKRWDQRYRGNVTIAEESGQITRKTGALRRELSMILQDTLSHGTEVCLEKQAAARRG